MPGNQPVLKRSFLVTIFQSPDEPRLRAGWRLLVQTILLFMLFICAGVPLGLLAVFTEIELSDSLSLGLNQVIGIFAITSSIFLARRFLDKRSIGSLGLKLNKWAPLDILAGVAITFFMMGTIYLIEVSAGWLTFEGFAWQNDSLLTVFGGTLGMLVVFILVGWNEELLSRGYHLQTLTSGLNIYWAVLISSAIFGILHLGNPNADAKFFVAGGIFIAGVFLAYGYLATKELWLPIGLHIGWNFFEGVVFGFPVSGLDIYRLTHISVNGPDLWTGGPFGPEAGLVLIPGILVGTALVYGYSRFIRKQHPV